MVHALAIGHLLWTLHRAHCFEKVGDGLVGDSRKQIRRHQIGHLLEVISTWAQGHCLIGGQVGGDQLRPELRVEDLTRRTTRRGH
jgi:hypothetical protein